VVEPEVVATSPNRIKSPVPVCCGFGSRKNGGRERTCTRLRSELRRGRPPRLTDSRSVGSSDSL